MLIGEVIGNVWATKKYDGLDGLKFLIVKTEVGEKVIISTGSSARNVLNMRDLPVDAAIIGIIDGMDEE